LLAESFRQGRRDELGGDILHIDVGDPAPPAVESFFELQ
jgi:hypothetical protein